MTNYSIKDLELQIEDKFIEDAEHLVKKELKHFKQIEKNLWTAKFDNDSLETEVKLTYNKLQEFTCDCKTKQVPFCKHVLALLLKIREEKKNKALKRKIKKQKKTTITTDMIFERSDIVRIKAFFKEYAAKDKQFFWEAKARFLGDFPELAIEDKYKLLLSSSIKKAYKTHSEINLSGYRKFSHILWELYHQAEKFILQKNYLEASAIFKSIFPVLPSLLRRNGKHHADFSEFFTFFINLLDDFLDEPLPPNMVISFRDLLVDNFSKTIYFIQDKDQLLFKIIITKFKNKNLIFVLWSILEELELSLDNNNQAKVLYYKSILEDKTKSEEIKLQKFYPDLIILNAVRLSFNKKDFKTLKKLSKKLKSDNKQVNDFLLRVAIFEDDKKAGLAICKTQFLRYKQENHYKILKQLDPSFKWAKQIIAHFEKNTTNNLLIGKIYKDKGASKELIQFLSLKNELKLLFPFTEFLLSTEKEAIFLLYKLTIKDYLNDHFGPKPIVLLMEMFGVFHKINALNLHKRISNWMQTEFKDRKLIQGIIK